jgi:Fe-S-cluster containining protein
MVPNSAAEAFAGNPIDFIRSSTPQLRAWVATQRMELTAAAFDEFVAKLRSVYEKYTEVLAGKPAGPQRGRALQRMMDTAVTTASHVKVSCRMGCSGCCHSEVEITTDEASVLLENVLGGVEIDVARLKAQAARERLSPAWAKFWSLENRCVFLSDEGACRIYKDRPSVCRRLLATTPPEACTTAGAAVAPVTILHAEVLLSAAIGLDDGGCSSMSKLLLPAIQESAGLRPPAA